MRGLPPEDSSCVDDSAERRALDEVTLRLTGLFQHLPPEVVTQTVNDLAGQLQAARIREFIPLLVEKEARDLLRTRQLVAPVPAPRTEVVWADA